MADRKACVPNILRTMGWIALKFDVVVLCVGPQARIQRGGEAQGAHANPILPQIL